MSETPPSPAVPSRLPLLTFQSILPLNVLALDMGDARIGVAYKAAGQTMTLPIAVVSARPERACFKRLHQMMTERDIQIVVVGLPVHEDQTQADQIKRSIRRLRNDIRGIRWRFHDETLTSSAAADIGRELAETPSNRPDDDRAAAIILDSFLASLPKA